MLMRNFPHVDFVRKASKQNNLTVELKTVQFQLRVLFSFANRNLI